MVLFRNDTLLLQAAGRNKHLPALNTREKSVSTLIRGTQQAVLQFLDGFLSFSKGEKATVRTCLPKNLLRKEKFHG